MSSRSGQVLGHDAHEAVVALATDVERILIDFHEDHHNVELGENLIDLRNTLSYGLQAGKRWLLMEREVHTE